MSLIHLSVKHGRTLDEARARVEEAVQQVCTQFAGLVQRVEWAYDRNSVKLFGPGIEAELRVDPQEVHVTGDIPLLGRLFGAPVMDGLKRIVEDKMRDKG